MITHRRGSKFIIMMIITINDIGIKKYIEG